MRRLTMLGVVCLAAFSVASAARADDARCKNVSGHAVETLIPAPNDPLGRVLGAVAGDLQGPISSVLTSWTPQPDGSIKATSLDVWVLGPQDILIFICETTLTPIPGAPAGTFSESTICTVTGGTGEFAGASGSFQITGAIFNLSGPKAGPGGTYFDGNYTGSVCRAN
jgi:hypothetical protein